MSANSTFFLSANELWVWQADLGWYRPIDHGTQGLADYCARNEQNTRSDDADARMAGHHNRRNDSPRITSVFHRNRPAYMRAGPDSLGSANGWSRPCRIAGHQINGHPTARNAFVPPDKARSDGSVGWSPSRGTPMNWRRWVCRVLRHKLVLDVFPATVPPRDCTWRRLRCVYCGATDPYQTDHIPQFPSPKDYR